MGWQRKTRRAIGGLVGWTLLTRAVAMRGWGLKPGEANRPVPGDDVITQPDQQLTHGVTIAAPPSQVWPWIAQTGYGRGGWYTPAWIDRYLWRVEATSLDHIDPDLQDIAAGDVIPDGPPGTATFSVMEVRPRKALVLHSKRHPVTGVPPDLRSPNPGPYLDFSWSFFLEPIDTGRTRLLLRTRGIAHVEPVAYLLGWLVWPAVDYMMSRWMLRGIKQRAESYVPVPVTG